MGNKIKIGKVTKEELLTMDKKISREEELKDGGPINHHRVHESKKTYNRKRKHKKDEDISDN